VITSVQNTIVHGRMLLVPLSQNVTTTSREKLDVHQSPAQHRDAEAIVQTKYVRITLPLSLLVLLLQLLTHAIIQVQDIAFGILLAMP